MELTEFIQTERNRFENENNNKFAFTFSEITRYFDMIQIIQKRYKKSSQKFIDNTKALQASIQNKSGTFTPAQMQVLSQGRELSLQLHLDIESFYLFAKILLDKIAQSL